MKTEIEISDSEDYESWKMTFEDGEISIIRDGFENGAGVYRGDFNERKVRKMYEAMKKYYEGS